MVRAVVLSQDFEIISLCEDLGEEIGMEIEKKQDLVNFILALQESDYHVALFDYAHMDTNGLKWIKVIRRIRPKIPLIIFSDEVDQKTGGKIYEEGTFYLCIRPIQRDVVRNALSAAITSKKSRITN